MLPHSCSGQAWGGGGQNKPQDQVYTKIPLRGQKKNAILEEKNKQQNFKYQNNNKTFYFF